MSNSTRNSLRRRPIRVAHAVDVLALAGMEYGVIKLTSRLDPDRFEPLIVCLRHQTDEAGRLIAGRIPVHELRKPEGRDWRVIARLADLLRRERVDIVHSHNWSTFLYSVAAARLAKVPILVHGEHGKDETTTRRARLLASRLLARAAARVCAVTRDLAEELIREWRLPRERVAFIPNGVDLDAFGRGLPFDGLRDDLGLTAEDEVIMTTGGFRPIKDLPTLVRAFALVHERRPRARLVLVGKGGAADPRAGLDRLAEDLGVAGAVRFAGVRSDIPNLLGVCDVYVNSSRYEGMSNTILEAMAAGRPVVATAVGGNPELVNDGVTGLLVPSGRPELIADRVERLLADGPLRTRMGAAGRARTEAEHSMMKMIGAYSDLYEELWAKRPARSHVVPLPHEGDS